jgi:hypothetical protein
MDIVFDVAGELYPLRESASTILAEGLRLKAKGEYAIEGVKGALGVANQIEDVLVGERREPIPLDGDAAEAVFYYLNVAASEPPPQERALYDAVHKLHRDRHN